MRGSGRNWVEAIHTTIRRYEVFTDTNEMVRSLEG
jgi:hypothetical protein